MSKELPFKHTSIGIMLCWLHLIIIAFGLIGLEPVWGPPQEVGSALGGGWGFAENAWSRPITESGVIIGTLFIAWRIWITKDLLVSCIRAVKRGSYLAIFLFGAVGPILLFGLFGQPTNLGFAAFGGGLCLAAAVSQKP